MRIKTLVDAEKAVYIGCYEFSAKAHYVP